MIINTILVRSIDQRISYVNTQMTLDTQIVIAVFYDTISPAF